MEWNIVCKITSLRELQDYTYVFLINDKEARLAALQETLADLEEKIKQKQEQLDSTDGRRKKKAGDEAPSTYSYDVNG